MKYIGFLEMEAGKISRFMKKVIEGDDLPTVFNAVWIAANDEAKPGYIQAEVEPNLLVEIVKIAPLRGVIKNV